MTLPAPPSDPESDPKSDPTPGTAGSTQTAGAAPTNPVVRYRIVRLQVQTEPLKVGQAPLRRYDPSPIESVPRIEVAPAGVIGLRRGRPGSPVDHFGSIIDVHHVDHERTRDRKGIGGVTIMGTGDYDALRARYGDHLTEGIAGETILVDAPDGLARLEMPPAATVITADGPIVLTNVRVADPCVEFARFCLRQGPSPVVDDAVRQALADLGGGARGYRAVADRTGVIAVGDDLLTGSAD
ncbi:hypothetical protein SAMN04515671_1850 [Nakamurella panacisegetis]|uniref:MOSC domain-containing protein n=1 Tax=Nakamurella panacisegetis TaxID=1090615 RepID=A0A1H0LXX0_9ACTN|nr:hypothetical protein [Nakamurella panacisegetis]SDO72997.1 hypothetical protein SAMN04515671_1850 [Nakamurella panacisegetis]